MMKTFKDDSKKSGKKKEEDDLPQKDPFNQSGLTRMRHDTLKDTLNDELQHRKELEEEKEEEEELSDDAEFMKIQRNIGRTSGTYYPNTSQL